MQTRKLSRTRGQSLVETALMIPLLPLLILNAVNVGYFFLVTLNLTSAPPTGSLSPPMTLLPDSFPVGADGARLRNPNYPDFRVQ